MARTDTLPHFLTDVADAIRTKKGTSETIQASDFDTEIENLPSGGGAKVSPKTITFDKTSTTLDLTNLDTSQMTSLYRLFYQFSSLQEIKGLEQFDTSNVTQFTAMFQQFGMKNLGNIEELNLSSFRGTSAQELSRMFYQANALKRLDLSNFDVQSNGTSSFMFGSASSLEHLDMRNFTFTNLGTCNDMFNNVPTTCEIIVKDQTQKDWFTTNFPTLTNVKTVAEYEAE